MSAEGSSSIAIGPRRRAARIVRPDKSYLNVRYEIGSGVTVPELSGENEEVVNQRILAHRARIEREMARLSAGMTRAEKHANGYEMGKSVRICWACVEETCEPKRRRWKKLKNEWLCETCYNLVYEMFTFLMRSHLECD